MEDFKKSVKQAAWMATDEAPIPNIRQFILEQGKQFKATMDKYHRAMSAAYAKQAIERSSPTTPGQGVVSTPAPLNQPHLTLQQAEAALERDLIANLGMLR